MESRTEERSVRDRERLSVQVDQSQFNALRARAVNGLSLSDVVRQAIAAYLSKDPIAILGDQVAPPAQERQSSYAPVEVSPSDIAKSIKDLPRVNGFRWADVDDPAQLALARAAWDQDHRDDPPSVFPYSSSAGEDPANAGGIEGLTVEQLWAWVSQHFAPSHELAVPPAQIPSLPA